ncbi:hypothetical protein [Clostridium magnum]|uniref:Uncharacterized protein n=1 Tax=Clostridium magnum DSM 2767 TaxID=1121326 RepID=A0A161W0W4_9CLOT|nr:hypothetical protein [Clostridium magnum]KZL88780.1 hypothetical protein CLMAG_58730 [Clostridium magnum DSM 2767]SHJ57554.1 hypothetical protein SAMN02745944_06179 [Clostridium magnum DSM 2767]
MNDTIVITSIVCVSLVSIVGIFSILAYLKDTAALKLKNNFKHLSNEISITTGNEQNSRTKKL